MRLTCLVLAMISVTAVSLHAAEPPLAWIRFADQARQEYNGFPYLWLGDAAVCLTIDVPPADGRVLDLLWGSKNDQRAAQIVVNDVSQQVEGGGYDGFRWQRVKLPDGPAGSQYTVELRAAQPRAAFLAAVRLVSADAPVDQPLPDAQVHRIRVSELPPGPLTVWMGQLRREKLDNWQRAVIYGNQASEALRRCRKYVDGWLAHADPKTGLIPRNLNESKFFWNGRDSAADNYAFMVLTSALADRSLFDGRMLDMLKTETKLTSRIGALPADYDFNKRGFRFAEPDLNRLIFDGSEYVKDGLMPITEWLGHTPWSDRMLSIIDSIVDHAPCATPFGKIPADNVEVNGEMMQVLSRLRFMTGDEKYLNMACRIADYYLLDGRHPTRDVDQLRLRDHGCELISGLTEVYAACHFLRPDKAQTYRTPIHAMLDDILKVGLNEHGLMYNAVNPKTGAVISKGMSDNWGYNYNGFYTVYLLDQEARYRTATRRAMASLKPHYWNYPWEGQSADGIADSVEGAINLLNREPDMSGVPEWIDANMARMLLIQRPDGVIEGWHGDGNYARTAIMWALWKQQGVTIRPWRDDVKLGAVRDGQTLHLVLTTDHAWRGKLIFDIPRHKTVMRMPIDYPRINQFPEWFTAVAANKYEISSPDSRSTMVYSGMQLRDGMVVEIPAGVRKRITVRVVE